MVWRNVNDGSVHVILEVFLYHMVTSVLETLYADCDQQSQKHSG